MRQNIKHGSDKLNVELTVKIKYYFEVFDILDSQKPRAVNSSG